MGAFEIERNGPHAIPMGAMTEQEEASALAFCERNDLSAEVCVSYSACPVCEVNLEPGLRWTVIIVTHGSNRFARQFRYDKHMVFRDVMTALSQSVISFSKLGIG